AHEVEINKFKERVKLLEDREGVAATRSGDNAPIKRRSMDEGEAATERISDDSEEMVTILTSMDAATHDYFDVVPTISLVFATATVVTPYKRKKGKEVTIESETTKKQKVQEQIDAQESAKKQKTSEEVLEEAMSPEEVPEEKVKEMMQLVPIEEVYVEALQVKHPIIDWKVYTEGQRSYWKNTREDLNQLWRLVKETLRNRPPTSDKEMEIWVELSRLYEPDHEDQLTKNLHAIGEGLPSKEGSSTCDDQLQASSGELLTDGE
nr:hypothetical protein [Tanacetum cinerariifolium]